VRLLREMIEFIAGCFMAYALGWLLGVGFVLGSCMSIMFFIHAIIN